MARQELAKVQTRNQNYYNWKTRERKLRVGDRVLLLLPTEQNKLTLAWVRPYKVVEVVREVDYRIESDSEKVKTYHINMLKRYYHRDEKKSDKSGNKDNVNNQDQVHQAASVACVLENEETVEDLAMNDAAILPTYNLRQKKTAKNVVVNEKFNEEKKTEVRKLLEEYKEIFSDVPSMTNLIEHKVELTDSTPIKHKSYPIPYKMQEVIDKEIKDMLAMEVIERSEAS